MSFTDYDLDDDRCPACGRRIHVEEGETVCRHGAEPTEEIDVEYEAILALHRVGNHHDCDPEGCLVAQEAYQVRYRSLRWRWTHEVDGEVVSQPCARLDWSVVPGYWVILIEEVEGDRGSRRKIAVPAHEVEYVDEGTIELLLPQTGSKRGG